MRYSAFRLIMACFCPCGTYKGPGLASACVSDRTASTRFDQSTTVILRLLAASVWCATPACEQIPSSPLKGSYETGLYLVPLHTAVGPKLLKKNSLRLAGDLLQFTDIGKQ